jgi:hypothetical protein
MFHVTNIKKQFPKPLIQNQPTLLPLKFLGSRPRCPAPANKATTVKIFVLTRPDVCLPLLLQTVHDIVASVNESFHTVH